MFVALFPLVNSIGVITSSDDSGATGSSRGSRMPLTVNGTTIKTITKDSNYDWVWVKDDAKLIFNGGIHEIKGRLNVTDNGSVVIKGTLTAWYVNAHCKSFNIMDGGILTCRNDKSTTLDGLPSIVLIHTKDPIEISNKGTIDCKCPVAASAPNQDSSGRKGGSAEIELMSDSYISITGSSVIKVTGGTGGAGDREGIDKGGKGGPGKITIQANGTNTSSKISMLIDVSTINGVGGTGGGTSGKVGSSGGDGGLGEINIISKSSNKISGLGGPGVQGGAEIYFNCKSLLVDEYKSIEGVTTYGNKYTQLWADSISHLISIDASNGAHLYIPDLEPIETGKVIPKAVGSTKLYIYHPLYAYVKDNSGNDLEKSTVTATVNPTIAGSTEQSTTDKNGLAILLLYWLITKSDADGSESHWKITASKSGAEAKYPKNVIVEERVNEITIIVTLVTVEILRLKFGGNTIDQQDFVDGMIVYGSVKVEGEAKGPNTISSVEVWAEKAANIDKIGPATDDSGTNEPAYDNWSIDWDSSEYSEGNLVMLGVTATDNSQFVDSDYINVTICETPAPPVITVITPENNEEVKDTDTGSKLKFEGTAVDENWDSKLLNHSRSVEKIIITIKDKSGIAIINTELKAGSGLQENQTSHSYTWAFDWNTRQIDTQGNFIYPNGNYSVEISALDNTYPTPLESIKTKINVHLHHIVKPTAIIKDITAEKNAEKKGYEYRDYDKTGIFKFKSSKGKSEVTLRFDLSSSYDPDKSQLKYYIDFDDISIFDWGSESVIDHEYFVYASEKKEVKSYNLVIKIKDEDNVENEKLRYESEKDGISDEIKNLTIIIEFIPEDPAPKTPLGEFLSLPLAKDEIRVMFVILIIIFNLVAVLMIVSKFKKINKRRQAREAALHASRQKQQSETEKKKTDIYSHLEFVDDGEAKTGIVATAGAVGAMELPTEEALSQDAYQVTKPEEPEAPQLISVGQPVFESAFDASTEATGTTEQIEPETAPGTSVAPQTTTTAYANAPPVTQPPPPAQLATAVPAAPAQAPPQAHAQPVVTQTTQAASPPPPAPATPVQPPVAQQKEQEDQQYKK